MNRLFLLIICLFFIDNGSFAMLRSAGSIKHAVSKTIEPLEIAKPHARPFTANKRESNLPKLNRSQFYQLVQYSKNFLTENARNLACQKNESGFVRTTLPAPKVFSDKIEKIRLNYWPGIDELEISPESIHDHPRYFESQILFGGYNHEIFARSNNGNALDRYRIFKNKQDERNFIFKGSTKLQSAGEKSLQEGAIVTFPKSLIHRVLSTQPSTLTLNVVFKKENNDEDYCDVYISEVGNSIDVKTRREILIDDEAKEYIYSIIDKLNQFAEKNKSL